MFMELKAMELNAYIMFGFFSGPRNFNTDVVERHSTVIFSLFIPRKKVQKSTMLFLFKYVKLCHTMQFFLQLAMQFYSWEM